MTAPQTGRIFISYRRADSAGYAGRIYDRLAAHFGKDAIFMDVDVIPAGLDFAEVLENEVKACDVLVALINRQWVSIKNTEGNRRLDNPQDFVRIEIAAALRRGIRVIPVLFDGTPMPHSTDLPHGLKRLARRNAVFVEHHSFHSNVNHLVTQLEMALAAAEESRVLKAKELKEKKTQEKRQTEIENFLAQADVAIQLQGWALAKEKLKGLLALAPEHPQGRAKLEFVERKLAEINQKKLAKEKSERETDEKAAQEKAELEAAEKVAKEKAEREAAEKAAKEKVEHEAAEKAAREKAERDAAEKVAKEKAEREAAEKAAKEKAEREAAEKGNKEKAKRVAATKAVREKAEREVAKKTTVHPGVWAVVVVVIAVVGFIWIGSLLPAQPKTTDYASELTSRAPAAEEPAEEPAVEEPMKEFEGRSVEVPDCDYGGIIKSITAVDRYTVEFSMCRPDPAFPAKAAFTVFGIYPEEWLARNANKANQETLLSAPIGTGPFVLENWARGESIIFKAYDDYWGEKPAYDTLVFRWATDGMQRLLELQSGTVDQITNLSISDFTTAKNDSNLVFLPVTSNNVLYLGMVNVIDPLGERKESIFGDVNVRKAIAMGIDRQRIVDNFYPEGSLVPTHFTPCSIPNGCVGDPWYDFDPETAKAILAEAGYPDGFATTVYYRDVYRDYLPEPGLIAVEFQSQLAENLGITAEVIVMESGEFIDESTNGRLDGLYLLGWPGDYPHVTNFLDFHFAETNPQYGDPHPEIYEVLQEASQIGDPVAAEPLYVEANNAIRELIPMVPIANGSFVSAALNTVENSHYPSFGFPRFAKVNPGKSTFVYMQNYEPTSLFCQDEWDNASLAACQQIVEPLLGYAIDSGNIEPRLATACNPNADSTIWTCTLRKGVTFHDGTSFDANDVVVSWAAGIDASNPNHIGNNGAFEYYSYLFDGLMNME